MKTIKKSVLSGLPDIALGLIQAGVYELFEIKPVGANMYMLRTPAGMCDPNPWIWIQIHGFVGF